MTNRLEVVRGHLASCRGLSEQRRQRIAELEKTMGAVLTGVYVLDRNEIEILLTETLDGSSKRVRG